jgi:hypothetical protein
MHSWRDDGFAIRATGAGQEHSLSRGCGLSHRHASHGGATPKRKAFLGERKSNGSSYQESYLPDCGVYHGDHCCHAASRSGPARRRDCERLDRADHHCGFGLVCRYVATSRIPVISGKGGHPAKEYSVLTSSAKNSSIETGSAPGLSSPLSHVVISIH